MQPLLPEVTMGRFRKILVATDFSADAARAQDVAVDLARDADGTVTLLHVCQMPAYAFFNGVMYLPTPELVGDIIRDADRALAEATQRIRGIPFFTARIDRGEPAAEITRYAHDEGFDLIVMGTHGRRGLKRLALGSVAEHVVRTADCPVVTVRATPESVAHAGAA
jgi:nucleotide-binding universal stress UspA family protein